MSAVIYLGAFFLCSVIVLISNKISIGSKRQKCPDLTVKSLKSILTDPAAFFKSRKYPAENKFLKALVIGFPIILLMAVRYGVGTDYFNYQKQIRMSQLGLWKLDLGLDVIVKISYWLYPDFRVFIALTSVLIGMLFVFWAVFYCDREVRGLSLFCLFCLFFGSWCNNIQQSLALGVAILSLKYVFERKLIKFIIVIAIAGILHPSAFLFSISYILYQVGKGRKVKSKKETVKLILLIVFAMTVYVFYLTYGVSHNLLYSSYITSTREGGRFYKYLLSMSPLYVMELLFYPRVIRQDKRNILFYIFVMIEFVSNIATMRIAFAYRVGLYFTIGHILLISEIIKYLSARNYGLSVIVRMIFAGICAAIFIFLNIYSGYNGIIPYRIIGG